MDLPFSHSEYLALALIFWCREERYRHWYITSGPQQTRETKLMALPAHFTDELKWLQHTIDPHLSSPLVMREFRCKSTGQMDVDPTQLASKLWSYFLCQVQNTDITTLCSEYFSQAQSIYLMSFHGAITRLSNKLLFFEGQRVIIRTDCWLSMQSLPLFYLDEILIRKPKKSNLKIQSFFSMK